MAQEYPVICGGPSEYVGIIGPDKPDFMNVNNVETAPA